MQKTLHVHTSNKNKLEENSNDSSDNHPGTPSRQHAAKHRRTNSVSEFLSNLFKKGGDSNTATPASPTDSEVSSGSTEPSLIPLHKISVASKRKSSAANSILKPNSSELEKVHIESPISQALKRYSVDPEMLYQNLKRNHPHLVDSSRDQVPLDYYEDDFLSNMDGPAAVSQRQLMLTAICNAKMVRGAKRIQTL